MRKCVNHFEVGARSKLDGSYIAGGTTSNAGVANVELPVGTGGFAPL